MTSREANAALLAEITALRDRVASLSRENAELQGALAQASEQQTATREILRIISTSPTDVQPVFDAIVQSALRLLRAHSGALTRITGDCIELAAFTSTDESSDAVLKALFPMAVHANTPHAHAIRDRAPLNIGDTETDPRVPETGRASARARGYRSLILVPMLR
jgi:two-component system, NtrC family, sensor kinase